MPKLDAAAFIALISLAVQAWNAWMWARVDNRILKSEQKILEKADVLYVRKDSKLLVEGHATA